MADETDDLEYSEANVGSAQAQGVRKNISLKLKGKSRGRGRGKARRTKKTVTPEEDDQDETENTPTEKPSPNKQCVESNLDDVMSKLEAPTFNPMDRTHPEPLHQNNKLRWDHKVNLIGEKVIDPLIHCCEKCSLPILNYGRMIPCKHVFCFDCAKKADKVCPKCEEKVTKVEPSTLGTVFMCNFGGSRHVPGPCGRTYLSQRDLQAHINHRHLKPASMNVPATTSTVSNTTNTHLSRDPRDPRAHLHVDVTSHQQPIHMQTTPDSSDHTRNLQMGSPLGQPIRPYQTSIPVSNTRPNLITVPIQDDGATPPPAHVHAPPPPAHAPQYAAPPPIPQSYAYHPVAAPPVYSQAPAPLPTQTYSQPPQMHHHPPPPSGPALYSAPPPSVVHHQPPPTTYTAPRPIPQHFPPGGSGYEGEPQGYMVQWTATRGPPPPRPISAPPPQQNPNVRHMPPRGPPDPGYRQPYYQ